MPYRVASFKVVDHHNPLAKTETWSDVVKGLKTEDKLETANSDKSGSGSETADLVEQFDSDEPNHMSVKRTKRQRKICQHRDNERANQGLMSKHANQRGS